jgi:hypothetical protein
LIFFENFGLDGRSRNVCLSQIGLHNLPFRFEIEIRDNEAAVDLSAPKTGVPFQT